MDELHLIRPYLGSRQLCLRLRDQGYTVNRKPVQRLMRLMGIAAIYPKPRTSLGNQAHSVYPYLLKDLSIARANQVWVSDITYIPMHKGFCDLVANMGLFSRRILSWRLSNTLDSRFCMTVLTKALATYPRPDIFNTDRGSQYTRTEFTSLLQHHNIQISMDSKGRWIDNVLITLMRQRSAREDPIHSGLERAAAMIERFWRSLKYEEVYPRA